MHLQISSVGVVQVAFDGGEQFLVHGRAADLLCEVGAENLLEVLTLALVRHVDGVHDVSTNYLIARRLAWHPLLVDAVALTSECIRNSLGSARAVNFISTNAELFNALMLFHCFLALLLG